MVAPTNIVYHRNSRQLEVVFVVPPEPALRLLLDAEYLRVYSPSAEVRGHGPEERTLVTGKKQVGIEGIEGIGNYAIRLTFDDGHDTGLYTWDYLRELATNHTSYWADYERELKLANASRLPHIPLGQVVQWAPDKPA